MSRRWSQNTVVVTVKQGKMFVMHKPEGINLVLWDGRRKESSPWWIALDAVKNNRVSK